MRVTEAAALAAARHLGRGDKNAADGAAVDAMRGVLNAVSMRGVVVLGEGEKDAAPMLFNGEEVGDGTGPRCDVSVDPIDGTTLVSKGRDGAIAVIAVAAEGAMLACGGSNAPFYQNKLIVGPQINPHHVSLRWPVARNVRAIATALNKPVEDVTVCILDRPRHEQLIGEVRDCGARIKLISDGDIAAAIEAADPTSPVDVVMGIGGSPEGVIAVGFVDGRQKMVFQNDQPADFTAPRTHENSLKHTPNTTHTGRRPSLHGGLHSSPVCAAG